eukprot:TRINITY_DN9684_c0_g1_i2.p1 TRINITY_DN9684_c0_g1~~TRINITY_DN9684_c0_g1_i2.p1  ORF type:complete len:399 (-),score=62.75 TRINITY_DN9684_c0_g1_i2:110-1306(-)
MEMSDKPTTVSDFCSAQDWRAEFRHTLSSFQTWTNGTFSRRSLDIQTLGMRHLALSADMVAIAGNTAVYAWHMTDSSRNVVVPIPHPDGPSCVSLSQSYVAAGVEGCVAVYSFEQKEMIHCFTAPHSERTYIAAVYIDSLSNRIYSIGRGDFRFCIWSLSTGTCLDSFRLTSSPVSLCVEDNYISIGCYSGEIYLFDRTTATQIWRIQPFVAGIESIAITVNTLGAFLVASASNGALTRYELHDGTAVWRCGNYSTFQGRACTVLALPTLILAQSRDGTVQLLSPTNGAAYATAGTDPQDAYGMDERNIVVIDADARVQICDHDGAVRFALPMLTEDERAMFWKVTVKAVRFNRRFIVVATDQKLALFEFVVAPQLSVEAAQTNEPTAQLSSEIPQLT